jgi:hypothetical protein
MLADPLSERQMTLGWQQPALGLVVTLLGSWAGVNLGLRKYRREKWWERKATAYVSILDAMFNIKRNADYYVRQYESETQTPEIDAELQDLAHKGNLELDRAIALGTFLLSRETAQLLQNAQNEILSMSPHLIPPEEADAWSEISGRYAAQLVTAAKADLGVTSGLEIRYRLQRLLAKNPV